MRPPASLAAAKKRVGRLRRAQLSADATYVYQTKELHFPVGMPRARMGYRVFYNAGVFTSNISSIVVNPLTEGAPGVTTYYIDLALGNDTTGNGTSGNPYKTINKAMTVAQGLALTSVLMKAKGGRYKRGQGWLTSSFSGVTVALVSWDGSPVYLCPEYPSLSWSLDSGTTYTATSDSTNPARSAFWDKKVLGPDGDYVQLTLAASLVACRATPQSYFVTGTSMYVNRLSGLAPDADLICMDNDYVNVTFNKPSGFLYLDNVRCEGGSFAFVCNMSANPSFPITIMAKDCWFKYGASAAIARDSVFSIQANATVFHWNSVIAWSIQDGCGYNNAATNYPPPYVVEEGCIQRWNGYTSSLANQGSTMHVGGNIIRVNGLLHHNQDCQAQDVTGSRSLNLGTTLRDTLTADAAAGVGFALAADTGSEGWYFGCTTSGCPADLLCGTGVRLNYASHTPASPTTTGGGTFAVWTPVIEP